LQRAVVANVRLDEFVTRIFAVLANVRAFDFGLVEIVEIVNDRDLIDVRAEESIDQM
jgi:hypothetical protein